MKAVNAGPARQIFARARQPQRLTAGYGPPFGQIPAQPTGGCIGKIPLWGRVIDGKAFELFHICPVTALCHTHVTKPVHSPNHLF